MCLADIRGFGLLDFLVVIVFIGLFVGYIEPRYVSQVDKSEVKVARAQIDTFKQTMTML